MPSDSPIPLKYRTSPALRASVALFLTVILMGLSAVAGFRLGQQKGGVSSSVPSGISGVSNMPSSAKQADFGVFWQAWNIIDQNFYGDKDANKRLNGAISGMVAGLKDPYTVYMEPSQNSLFRSDLQGSFGGIGAELAVKDSQLTIVSALQGTPAEKAGLKAGDVILKINDKATGDMVFADAINAVRGEKGTTVKLTIGRPGTEKPFDVSLVRDTITVKSVATSAIGPNGSIAYVKVNQFGDDTVELLTAALKDAATTGKKGLLLDLRNNPGGYLDAAVQAIGMVIPSDVKSDQAKLRQRVAVLERDKNDHEKATSATNDPILDTLPMVVLVNGGSASASEIFSGAMKDYGRATLVGVKTFGKGSVQNLIDLSNGGSVKVTIAKWFTPLGTGIDGKGIEPDVKVDLPDGTAMSTDDPQAAKGLEILEQKIK